MTYGTQPAPQSSGRLRQTLTYLYTAAAALAAAALFFIFFIMMAQIVSRLMGFYLPGADDICGNLCIATTFFALAATFRRGELIRVSLLHQFLGQSVKHWLEAFVLAAAAVIVAYISYWTLQSALFSYEIEEVAQGNLPILIWVPKAAMPLGSFLLLIAIVDEFISVVRGYEPIYVTAARERQAAGDFSAEV